MTKKSTPRKSLAELKAEYLKIESIAKRFSDELVRQLQILIDEEKLYLGFPAEARIQ